MDGSHTHIDEALWDETARRYDRSHPQDSFADLAGRVSFSKEDRRLLEDWLAAVKANWEHRQ